MLEPRTGSLVIQPNSSGKRQTQALGNNRSLPSLARPSLLHRLDRKDSKIFVHPLATRLDVCNGHTRCLSECHLRWWTNTNEPRRISKTLHKSDAAPRLGQHIDVTRRIVGDESEGRE